MKLADFYRRIGPYLEGNVEHGPAVEGLYDGAARDGADARRLAIYGRFCRIHRHQVLEGVYAHAHSAVVARSGAEVWDALVHAYFTAHPMRHFELNENGAQFPDFLVGEAERQGWPAWLQELADFEWWEWLVKTAPDAPDAAGGEAGALRLGALVELRAYAHDLCGWIDDGPGPGEGEPAATPSHVLFWRDPHQDGRREPAAPLELLLLKWVFEGCAAPLEEIAPGLPAGDLQAKLDDLVAAGILEGGAT